MKMKDCQSLETEFAMASDLREKYWRISIVMSSGMRRAAMDSS